MDKTPYASLAPAQANIKLLLCGSIIMSFLHQTRELLAEAKIAVQNLRPEKIVSGWYRNSGLPHR